MDNDLKTALDGVKNDLEAKNANELKSLKDELTVAMNEAKEGNEKDFNEVKEALNSVSQSRSKSLSSSPLLASCTCFSCNLTSSLSMWL